MVEPFSMSWNQSLIAVTLSPDVSSQSSPQQKHNICLSESQISVSRASGPSRLNDVHDGPNEAFTNRWGAGLLWGGSALLFVSRCDSQETPRGGENHKTFAVEKSTFATCMRSLVVLTDGCSVIFPLPSYPTILFLVKASFTFYLWRTQFMHLLMIVSLLKWKFYANWISLLTF